MSEMISVKIDLNKILKEKLYQAGSGALYLDATLIPSRESRYGDSHFIVQSLSKADREAGLKGPIIGNAKIIGGKSTGPSSPAPRSQPSPRNAPSPTETRTFMKDDKDEDVPF